MKNLNKVVVAGTLGVALSIGGVSASAKAPSVDFTSGLFEAVAGTENSVAQPLYLSGYQYGKLKQNTTYSYKFTLNDGQKVLFDVAMQNGSTDNVKAVVKDAKGNVVDKFVPDSDGKLVLKTFLYKDVYTVELSADGGFVGESEFKISANTSYASTVGKKTYIGHMNYSDVTTLKLGKTNSDKGVLVEDTDVFYKVNIPKTNSVTFTGVTDEGKSLVDAVDMSILTEDGLVLGEGKYTSKNGVPVLASKLDLDKGTYVVRLRSVDGSLSSKVYLYAFLNDVDEASYTPSFNLNDSLKIYAKETVRVGTQISLQSDILDNNLEYKYEYLNLNSGETRILQDYKNKHSLNYKFEREGDYRITLTVRDKNGLVESSSRNLTVFPAKNLVSNPALPSNNASKDVIVEEAVVNSSEESENDVKDNSVVFGDTPVLVEDEKAKTTLTKAKVTAKLKNTSIKLGKSSSLTLKSKVKNTKFVIKYKLNGKVVKTKKLDKNGTVNYKPSKKGKYTISVTATEKGFTKKVTKSLKLNVK